MEVLAQVERTARKPHICNDGLGTIAKGEKYRDVRICDDGRVWTWKSCQACQKAMNKSDRPTFLYPEEAYPEGWAKDDGVGCAAISLQKV